MQLDHTVSLHGWFAPFTIKKYIKSGKVKGGIPSMSFGDAFKALSDPTRREILNLLKRGSMTAGQIVEHFDTTGAIISHHLNILR